MRLAARIITPPIKLILAALCRIDASALERVPARGPLIVVTNHVNFLEVPLLYAYLYPRPLVGIIKRETWDHPLLAALANAWEAIAIDREGSDTDAMRRSLDVLASGGILVLAPEGTRSGHGRLQKGRGGVVQLALRSGAPVMPIAHTGGERFWDNLRRLKRTDFRIAVGPAFSLTLPDGGDAPASVPKSVRLEMTEAVMNRLSLLLPEDKRGAYPEPEAAPMRVVRLLEEEPRAPAARATDGPTA